MNARITLHPARERQYIGERTGWEFVGSAFQRHSPHCDECSYCVTDRARLQVGDETVTKEDDYCALGERLSDKPEQCPAYAAHMENEHEDE